MEFSALYTHIGEVGLFQVLLYCLVGLCTFFIGVQNLVINFAGANQDHWCRIPSLENYPHDVQKYVAVPYSADDPTKYDKCSVYDIDYDALDPGDILNWNRSNAVNLTTRECQHGWVYDQGEFVSTITSKYDLVCSHAWLAQFVSTIYMFGIFTGSALSGIVSDRFGRHLPLLVGCCCHMAFTFGQAFAPNYLTFLVMRFLTALFAYTSHLTAFIIIMELVGPTYRTLLGCLYRGFVSVGIMVISLVAYAVRDHTYLFVIVGASIAVTFPFIWIVPESPRWLISKGRYDEAEKILRKVAAVNGKTFPDKIKWHTVNSEEKKEPSTKRSSVTLMQVCKSSILCKELSLLYLNWFTTSLVYYGLSLNAGSFGDLFLTTFLSGVVELPALVLCWLSMQHGSKRLSNAGCLLVAGAFCAVCVLIMLLDADQGTLLTVFSTLGKGAITFSYACIYLISAEMFPTSVRQKALGTSSMWARVGSMISPFMGAPLEAIWLPLPLLIFGAMALLTGSLVFMLPETKGHKLPDTIEEAEHIGRARKVKKTQSDSSTSSHMDVVTRQPTEDGRDNPAYTSNDVCPDIVVTIESQADTEDDPGEGCSQEDVVVTEQWFYNTHL